MTEGEDWKVYEKSDVEELFSRIKTTKKSGKNKICVYR